MAIVLLFNYFSVPAGRLIVTLSSIDFTRSYYGSLSQILIRGERYYSNFTLISHPLMHKLLLYKSFIQLLSNNLFGYFKILICTKKCLKPSANI